MIKLRYVEREGEKVLQVLGPVKITYDESRDFLGYIPKWEDFDPEKVPIEVEDDK